MCFLSVKISVIETNNNKLYIDESDSLLACRLYGQTVVELAPVPQITPTMSF